MTTIKDIQKETNLFFEKHWSQKITENYPKWKYNWKWEGSLPNYEKGGVYTLFNDDAQLVYVGLGISRGGGQYKECGLSRRLLSHVITTNKEKGRGYYVPQSNWPEVKSIATIGFDKEYTYLAAALEIYLIEKFKPHRNNQKNKNYT